MNKFNQFILLGCLSLLSAFNASATSYIDFTSADLTAVATNVGDTATSATTWALPVMLGILGVVIAFSLTKKFGHMMK